MASKYKAIDFFCGGGGMTCGLRQAGINVIAGVDFDQDAKETYEYNNSAGAIATVYAHNQQINPIEKVVELYERLLKSEQEKIEILRECIKQGK